MTDKSDPALGHSEDLANHPLVLQAIVDFRPRGGTTLANTLDMKSPSVVQIEPNGSDLLRAVSPMPRWLRQRMRAAETARLGTEIPGIFLIEGVVTWRRPKEDALRQAPLKLAPVSYDDGARSFRILGAAEPNRDIEAQLAIGQAIAVDQDADFRAVIMQTADLRNKTRLIDAAENPSALTAPAIRRLLGCAASPAVPIQDRLATLKARRSTPLDADQMQAYKHALTGADLLLVGPPGTGKSELIAELARAALESDRRVLIASSIESALTVVKDRLAKTDHVSRFASALAFETPDSFPLRPTNERQFDLLIVDEATRMTISEGLLLASRCRQMAICGDPHQLGAPAGRPDLFAHAKAIGIHTITLTIHYRSATPDLMLFSNTAAYDMRLRVTPSTQIAAHEGVRLITCPTARARQTPHGVSNTEEAECVAARLADLVASGDRRSKCVVTSSPAQAHEVRAALKRRGLGQIDLSPVHDEPFFIRIMNHVQGEERDITLVSLAFADQSGSWDGSLGIFENEGYGMERLNVALSRSRALTEIYTSFTASSFASERSQAARPFQVMLAAIAAGITTKAAFPPIKLIEDVAAYIRGPQDHFDNLGIVHGWAPKGASKYKLGILVRWKMTPAPIWDIAEAQLRVKGWRVVCLNPDDLKNDFAAAQKKIEAAASGLASS